MEWFFISSDTRSIRSLTFLIIRSITTQTQKRARKLNDLTHKQSLYPQITM